MGSDVLYDKSSTSLKTLGSICLTRVNIGRQKGMIKFAIEKQSDKVVLRFWEEACIEGDRIRPFTFKQNMICLDMNEAKSRFEIFSRLNKLESQNY